MINTRKKRDLRDYTDVYPFRDWEPILRDQKITFGEILAVLRRNGILVHADSRESLLDQMKGITLGYWDWLQFRAAYERRWITLRGSSAVLSKPKDADLKMEDIVSAAKRIKLEDGIVPNLKISKDKDKAFGALEGIEKRYRRNMLAREIPIEIPLEIEEDEDNQIRIQAAGKGGHDYRKVQQFVSRLAGEVVVQTGVKVVPKVFDIRTLLLQDRIALIFQKIIKHTYPGWQLNTVYRLKAQRADGALPKGELSEESMTLEERQILDRINEAILEGETLESSRLVELCKRRDFYFPLVGMRLRSTDHEICILVEFKTREKCLEVIVESLKKIQGSLPPMPCKDPEHQRRNQRFFQRTIENLCHKAKAYNALEIARPELSQMPNFTQLSILDWIWVAACYWFYSNNENRNEKIITFSDIMMQFDELRAPILSEKEVKRVLKCDALSHEPLGPSQNFRYLFRTKDGKKPLRGNKHYQAAKWRLYKKSDADYDHPKRYSSPFCPNLTDLEQYGYLREWYIEFYFDSKS
ncbi:MAG: hypothetical protein ACE5OZ_21785 [Candidatus Heimdallarchaeota archaeon]